MKLKFDFVINDVAGSSIAVPVGENAPKCYIKLNETAKIIFQLLKQDVSKDYIKAELKKQFSDADEKEINETVDEFTDKLAEQNYII